MSEAHPPVPPARSLVIGTPCYGGQVTHIYMTSVMQLQKACLMRGIPFRLLLLSGDALVTRARNMIATEFLDMPDSTHLMFIDADIGFDPEAVFRMLDFDVDIIGGLYPVKNIDWDGVKKCVTDGMAGFPASAYNYVVGFDNRQQIASRGPYARAKYIGNGFMLIKRRVFEQMKEKYPQFKYSRLNINPDPGAGSPNRYTFFDTMIDPQSGFYLPEDYTFCQRWVDIGGELWVDLKSKLTHLGPYHFVGDTSTVFAPADSKG